MNLFTFADITF